SVNGADAETFTHSLASGTTWSDVAQTLADQTYTFTATSDSTTLSFSAVSSSGDQFYGSLLGEVYVQAAGVTGGADTITGDAGNDVIQGVSGNDSIDGGAGND